MSTRTRIRLDWSRLLGFDQLDAAARDGVGTRLAKVGDKADGRDGGTRIGAKVSIPKVAVGSPKIGAKVGNPKIGARAGIIKIGAKVGVEKIGSRRRG